MGITPGVLHLNEGHSGFVVLEAIRSRMQEEGVSFEAALPDVAREVVFTTHTPVPAGHDRFSADLIEEHLGPLRDGLGLSHDRLMEIGRENPGNRDEDFCMTVLGLRVARRANAVSALHGEVSRAMWTRPESRQRRRSCADRTHHQRRARSFVARAANVATV